MEKPLLSLSTEHWLTGIAAEAHAIRGGIFYKADGIFPLNSAGGTAPTDNGLLRAGPMENDLTASVVVDTPVNKARDYTSTGSFEYIIGGSGHLYKLDPSSNAVSDVRADTQITNPSNGIEIFQSAGAAKYLYYWMKGFIGRWLLDGTSFATGTWADTWKTIGAAYAGYQHPTHQFNKIIFYGAGLADGTATAKCAVGTIRDDGAAGQTQTDTSLILPANFVVTDISDDGVYVVIAITSNAQSQDAFSDTRIIFWDGSDSLWTREYRIDDQFIVSLTRVGNSVIAQGQYGIYEVSFGGGVKKILARYTAASNSSTRIIGPGMAGTYGQGAYVFGQKVSTQDASGVHTIGKLSDNVPSAHFKPIAPTSGNVTMVETQAYAGKIFVGTDTPKLYYYQLSSQTAGLTGVFAQTVYIPLGDKYRIKHVDLIFGEPLVSGDSVTVQLKTDEDATTVATGLSAAMSTSFATDGAIRRKKLYPPGFIADEQLSIIVNFVAGCAKIKRIEVYGQSMTRKGVT